MKIKFKKAVLISVIMAVAFASACNKSEKQPSKRKEIILWSQSSAYKIMRNVNYDETFRKPLEYRLKAAKGEYHSAQIIMSPNYDVKEYTVSVNNLKNASGDELDKSNFEVYNQKYIEVAAATTGKTTTTGVGIYPDALLPFETAIEYKENTIAQDENQGIWITVFVPFDQPAGEYVGSFDLKIDGADYSVPAHVTVWDYEISKETHSQAIFQAQDFYIEFGELSGSKELLQKYDDEAVKYRVSPLSLTTKSTETLSDRVRYYSDPENEKITSFLSTIPIPTTQSGKGINRVSFYEKVKELVKLSATDGINYVKKAAVRPGYIDEPQWNNKYELANSVAADFHSARNAVADEIADDIASKGADSDYYCDFSDELIQSVRDIKLYVTTHYDSLGRLDNVKNYCVAVSNIQTAAERYEYQSSGESHWMYTANYATPGYQIDADMFESRVMSWLMYDNGFIGELYWQTALYCDIAWDSVAKKNSRLPTDPYSVPDRTGTDNGDGYLFYPGKPYGIFGPVPSVRLMTMRDGKEEYEYLYELERLYRAAGYDSRIVTDKLCPLLYRDMISFGDDNIDDVREAVVECILLAQKGVFITDYSRRGEKIVLNFDCKGTDTVKTVNGVAPSEYPYFADVKNTEYVTVVTSGGTELVLPLGGKTEKSDPFLSDSVVKVDESVGTAEIVNNSGADNVLKVDFAPDAETPVFRFNISDKELTKNDFAFNFRVYSESESDDLVFLKFYLVGSGGQNFVQDFKLEKGWNDISVSGIHKANWGLIRRLTDIKMEILTGDKYSTPDYVMIGDVSIVR